MKYVCRLSFLRISQVKFCGFSVTSTGSGQSIISLRQPLKYKHYGTIHGLSDGFGGFVDERAEVLLLSRRIVITSTDEPAPYNLEGFSYLLSFHPKKSCF